MKRKMAADSLEGIETLISTMDEIDAIELPDDIEKVEPPKEIQLDKHIIGWDMIFTDKNGYYPQNMEFVVRGSNCTVIYDHVYLNVPMQDIHPDLKYHTRLHRVEVELIPMLAIIQIKKKYTQRIHLKLSRSVVTARVHKQ